VIFIFPPASAAPRGTFGAGGGAGRNHMSIVTYLTYMPRPKKILYNYDIIIIMIILAAVKEAYCPCMLWRHQTLIVANKN
jgi:hypothetical protein